MKGKYPTIFENNEYGIEAKKLFDDANKLLDKIISEKLLTAKSVCKIFPANSFEDDILLFENENSNKVISTFHTLRQQNDKQNKFPNLALSDFIAPQSFNINDYIGLFAVTAGIGSKELVEKFEKDHDDYNAIMVKALADRLAEAYAEFLHEKVRKEIWGYAKNEEISKDDLIKEKYTGIRPAPGYPALPDHTEKITLFNLLDVEKNIGISLTENLAMNPPASICGLYFANHQAKYFSVGNIKQDQVEDYARRKNVSVEEIEKWLRPII